MKILVISDIHANRHALHAVLDKEDYDGLIFLGDVVDFGPDPKNCIRFLINASKKRFWGVRGNHDHAMAFGITSKTTEKLKAISSITSEWGEGFLVSEEVGFLRRLPMERDFSIDGIDFELAHARDAFFSSICNCRTVCDDSDKKKEALRRFILTGHSHKPFIKHFGNTTIVNPGSVGQPRDYDPRASYAVIEDGEACIRRVSYDIDKTVKDIEKSTLPHEAKSRLISILLSGAVIN